ncbi:helix-turn-helix transcriptional regulator [Leptolyngbya sp. KIOST-1]|uniref:helix-turn-helix domain-containing protein n=1 Tax=Leptolyngbya sp. KIOST-1 TaxID=1229172 RepID=UPI00298E1394|nr:helix-turn-helix transcriptional regulator [Leptolyngbya sp. KIOST-1]
MKKTPQIEIFSNQELTLLQPSARINGMGQAGKALRQVLETYRISQNRVAVKMGVGRSNVCCWVNKVCDPGAEMVLQLRDALREINSEAADEFVRLYLDDAP